VSRKQQQITEELKEAVQYATHLLKWHQQCYAKYLTGHGEALFCAANMAASAVTLLKSEK